MAQPLPKSGEPLSPRDLDRLDRLAFWLDDLVRIPGIGTRVGLDALLGLVPWLGDSVAAVLSLLILGSALRHRVPRVVVVRMAMNIAFDYVIGLVPVAGDVADVFVKSNRWNLELLRRHASGAPPSRADSLFVWSVLAVLALAMIGMLALGVVLVRAAAHTLAGWWR